MSIRRYYNSKNLNRKYEVHILCAPYKQLEEEGKIQSTTTQNFSAINGTFLSHRKVCLTDGFWNETIRLESF